MHPKSEKNKKIVITDATTINWIIRINGIRIHRIAVNNSKKRFPIQKGKKALATFHEYLLSSRFKKLL